MKFTLLTIFSLLLSCTESKESLYDNPSLPEDSNSGIDSGDNLDSGESPDSGENPDTGNESADNDGDGFLASQDCNDQDANIYPGATEHPCDGIDNDCNGVIDDGLAEDWYADPSKWEVMAYINNHQTRPYPTGMVITSTGEKWVMVANLSQDNRTDLYRWSDINTQFEKEIEVPEGIILNNIILGHSDHIFLAGVNNSNDSSVPIVLRLDPSTILIEEIVFNGFPEKSMIVTIKATETAFIAAGLEIIDNVYFWRTWRLPMDGGQVQLLDSFTLDGVNHSSSPTSLSVDSKGTIWVGGWAKDTAGIQHAILRKTTSDGSETVVDLSESNSNSGMYVHDLHIDKEEDVLLSISNNFAVLQPYWQLGHFSVEQHSLDIFDSTLQSPKVPDGIFQHPTGVLFVIGKDSNGFAFIKAGSEDYLETTWAGSIMGLAQNGDFTVDSEGAVWAYTSSWNIGGSPSMSGKILRYQCQ